KVVDGTVNPNIDDRSGYVEDYPVKHHLMLVTKEKRLKCNVESVGDYCRGGAIEHGNAYHEGIANSNRRRDTGQEYEDRYRDESNRGKYEPFIAVQTLVI